MSERSIDIVREYNFDPKEVIKGLNGYYESDKRNSYITIRRNDVEGPAYLSTLYLSALIEWLREDHDIFYRPGLKLDQIEAARSAAKMCCLRYHIKDEICKRGLWCDKDADIPALVDTLFKAYDECKEHRDKNRKDAVTLSKQNIELKEDVWKNVMKCIRQDPSQNGFDLPRACQDLIEDLKKREAEIKELKERIAELESEFKAICDEDDIFRTRALKAEEEVRKLNSELATKWTKTSLINWLQQRARHKGVELDDAFLYSDDAQYDWTDIVNFLFDEIVKMRQEIKEARKKHWNDLRDIYKALGRYDTCDNIDDFLKAVKAQAEYIESISRNAERETRKAVNDQLKKDTDYVANTLCDILEALGISKSNTAHLSIPELKDKAILRASVVKSERGRYIEQLTEENEKLKETIEQNPSDINKLIRDYCTKNDIIAPSRYFSDKACIEYLFSVMKLDQKDRSFAILQDLYRDIFKKQPDGLSAKDIATKILDRMLTTEDLLHKSVDSVNKECKATGRMMVESYKIDLKDYILKAIKKHGYRYEGLETKSIEDIVYRIIEMATCTNKSDISDRIHEICTAKGVELDDAFLYDDDYTWEDLVGFLCEEIRRLKKELEEAQKEAKQECYEYLWDTLKALNPDCDALKITDYEKLVDRIFYEMSLVNDGCKRCRREHSNEKLSYIRRTNKAEEEAKNLRSQIERLKGLINAMNDEVKDM